MGGNRRVARLVRHLDCLEGLGDRTDLIELNQNRVAAAKLNALLEALRVRDKKIVADQLNLVAELLRHHFPALPVLFIEAVLDGPDRILLNEALPVRNELLRGEVLAGLRLMIEADALVALPLGGSRIHREHKVLARLVACVADCRENVLNRVLVVL